MSPSEHDERIRQLADSYSYAGVGLQFAATLGLFGWAGHWLDGKLGSDPFGLAGGVLLGFALGTYSMIARFSPKKPKSKAEPTDTGPPEDQ